VKKKLNALMLIGIIGTIVTGSEFVSEYGRAIWGNKDIWWTPESMTIPLRDTRSEVEISIGREPLWSLVDHGSLAIMDQAGQPHIIQPADVRARINNWQKTRASMLHYSVFTAFLVGISLSCLVMGLVQKRTGGTKALTAV
jgi:hypothetical protein